MTPLEQLRAKLAQVAEQMAAITAAAGAAGGPMNDEQIKQFGDFDAEYKRLEASIAAMERADAIAEQQARPVDRVVVPLDPTAATATGTPVPGEATATHPVTGQVVAHRFSDHGFKKGFGEFLMKVREVKTSGRTDPRLMVNTISTFGGESVGGDGGYLVPPQFQQGIMGLIISEDSFLRALNPVPTNSNMLTVPTDEDPPWGTSGITAAKTAEGTAITHSKPAVKKVNVVMHNVKSLVPVSNESLRDIAFLAAYVQNKMGQKLRWKCENYCINGTGVDEPLGILNAGSLLSLASDLDSTTTILGARDVMAMKQAALPGAGGVWIINPTLQAQIWGLQSNSTAGYPLYTPNMKAAPDGGLLGSPLFKSEACKAYNTAGDILYVVPDGYILAFESGGTIQSVSLEFAFDQDLTCFKATLRMGGAPTLSSTITRADGVNTASHLVALAARS